MQKKKTHKGYLQKSQLILLLLDTVRATNQKDAADEKI